MTDKPENPPAFPVPDSNRYSASLGMDLRDYFAAKAMAAFMGNDSVPQYTHEDGSTAAQTIAETAYFMADAMLAERSK